jgi:hypothetical protein
MTRKPPIAVIRPTVTTASATSTDLVRVAMIEVSGGSRWGRGLGTGSGGVATVRR